jgi:hypothetical protein
VPVLKCKGQLGLAVPKIGRTFFPVAAGLTYRNMLAGLAFVTWTANVNGGFQGHDALIRQCRGLFKTSSASQGRGGHTRVVPDVDICLETQ